MNCNECFRSLDAGLPADIGRLKAAGWYGEAIACIDARLAEDWAQTQNGPAPQGLPDTGARAENPLPRLPEAQRECLTVQREVLRRMAADYPYPQAQAVSRASARILGFTAQEFENLVREDRIDWRFVDGERRYAARFLETLLDTDDGYAARAGIAPPLADRAARRAQADRMCREGSLAADIRLRLSIRASDAAFSAALAAAQAAGKKTVRVRAWLPIPAACPSQSGIRLQVFGETPQAIAPENAPQRTVYWEAELTENRPFSAEFSYRQTAVYRDPMAAPDGIAPAPFLDPAAALGEQAPHIRFTPYLRALTAEVTRGAASPAEKARRIYDFITCNVHYRYMPAYFTLDAIADTCVRSRRGDCGVQALAFLTMCRIAGIPAVWQSGLMVGPDRAGCHDWALFWLEGLGWLPADCSFGGSAARRGDEALRRHYFGNLDPGRMMANHAFQAPFQPPMEGWRSDPYDNQTGEIELDGVGLWGDERQTDSAVLSYQLLEKDGDDNG
jgi:hypothetical protein